MATRSLGTLTVDLIAKIGGFTRGLTEAEREADRTTRDMERKAKQRAAAIDKAWRSISVGLLAGFAVASAGVLKFVNESRQAEKEQGQLRAVLRSTGEAAGWSQERLNDMADAMSRTSTLSGGEINQAQTALLAFTGIVGNEFTRALQSGIDMSARTGMSVVSAAETVGRALDVPSRGMSALSQQGFRFTEGQKKLAQQLEATGRVSEAQDIILRALEETYGGAAQASRDTFGGALIGLQNELNNLMTGPDGSLSGATKAVNDLTSTLADEGTRTAFNTLIGWIVELSNSVIQVTANLIAFINTKDKIGALTGTDEFGKLSANAEGASARVSRLTDMLERHREALSRDPGNPMLARNVAKTEQLLRGAQTEALAAADALKDWANANDAANAPIKPNAPPVLPPAANSGNPLKPTKPTKDALREQKQQLETAKRYLITLEDQVLQVGEMNNYEKLNHDLKRGNVVLSEEQLSKAQGMATLLDIRAEKEREVEVALNRQNAQLAAQRQLRALVMGYDADVAGVGMGDRQREEMQQRVQMEQDFANRLQAIDDQRRQALATADDDQRARIEAMYADLLGIEQYFQAQSLSAYDKYIEQKRAADSDWSNGASRAWQNYVDQAQGAAATAESAISGWLQGAEDSLVNFVQTGKLNFSDFANSIIADLIRIAARQAIVGMFGSLFSMFGGTTATSTGTNPAQGLKGSWADGGFTGPGGKYDPAGVVHRGEFVINAASTKKLGLDYLNRLNGYANGGYVGAPASAADGFSSGDVIINIHGGGSGEPKVQSSTDGNGNQVIDVMYQQLSSRLGKDFASGRGSAFQGLNSRVVLTPRR